LIVAPSDRRRSGVAVLDGTTDQRREVGSIAVGGPAEVVVDLGRELLLRRLEHCIDAASCETAISTIRGDAEERIPRLPLEGVDDRKLAPDIDCLPGRVLRLLHPFLAQQGPRSVAVRRRRIFRERADVGQFQRLGEPRS
jgi:hypothetical protein